MFLGLLVSLGVDAATIRDAAAALVPDEFELSAEPASRGGISGIRARVKLEHHDHGHHHGRSLVDILELLAASRLDGAVASRAEAVFRRIAEAEGRIHGKPPEEVHFHEVGAVDSIVDVVGACAGLAALEVDRVTSSPVATGTGTVKCAHGELPLPAPATAEILRGLPVAPSGIEAELTTPTGAGLIAEFVDDFSPPPAGTIDRIGYGAGGRDNPDRPNVLRGMIYESAPSAVAETRKMTIVEAVVDDMTGEIAAELYDRLAEAGAAEVTVIPAGAKKGRPAMKISALSPSESSEAVVETLLRHSSTLGCRLWEVDRRAVDRRFEEVQTPWGEVRVKLGLMNGEVVNAAPEYDDCRRLADGAGVTTKQVMDAALAGLEESYR